MQAAQDAGSEPTLDAAGMEMTNAEVIARVRAVYKEEVLSRPSRPVLLEVPSGLLHR